MRTRKIELILFGTGFAFLAVWAGAWMYRTVYSRAAIQRFAAPQEHASDVRSVTVNDSASGSQPDFTLWSVKRIQAYRDSLVKKVDQPLAVLRIAKIQLEVPLYNDTDDLTLDRGVGRILGTSQVGAVGNLGIACHRDGFFRGLKDLALGDEIELRRADRPDIYVVEKIQIVNPEDVSVLNPTRESSLTLVTCFPFYYVGNAPQRFVVHASIAVFDQQHQEKTSQSKFAVEKNNNKENKR
jgi:sortase A